MGRTQSPALLLLLALGCLATAVTATAAKPHSAGARHSHSHTNTRLEAGGQVTTNRRQLHARRGIAQLAAQAQPGAKGAAPVKAMGPATAAAAPMGMGMGMGPAAAAAPVGGPLGPPLALFVDALTVPPMASATGLSPVTISAYKVMQKFHRDLPATWVYAFGVSEETASTPGPTIMAKRGESLTVRWQNKINDSEHMLPVDYTLGVPKLTKGGVPISPHVHGAVVQSVFDGHPDAWFTPNGETGPGFVSYDFVYPNIQEGSTLWYHDHTAGMTRLNVAAGLEGFYIIDNSESDLKLGLPSGAYDIPLCIADKGFDTRTGQISFPQTGATKQHPIWEPEYFGDYIMVNGKVSPFLNVEPTQYRFRLLNGANARFFTLTTSPPMSFYQIGADSGLLAAPVGLKSLTIGPGERCDLVFDFSALPAGTEVILTNSAPAPYSDGDKPESMNLKNVMKFVVTNGTANKLGEIVGSGGGAIGSLAPFTRLDASKAAVTRNINITEIEDEASGSPETSLLEGLHWMDPVTVKVEQGSTEVWNVINLTEDWHTFHIHLIPHQLLHRRAFNKELFMEKKCNLFEEGSKLPSCFTGPMELATGTELSWKDTTHAPTGYVTTLIIRFANLDNSTLPFDPTQGPGYVFHCHILDHEDNDMMRPFVVVRNSLNGQPKSQAKGMAVHIGLLVVALLVAAFQCL